MQPQASCRGERPSEATLCLDVRRQQRTAEEPSGESAVDAARLRQRDLEQGPPGGLRHAAGHGRVSEVPHPVPAEDNQVPGEAAGEPGEGNQAAHG